ncbi:putative ribonuclease H-like domain-containing protein, partial [Tanacetum coccineum]
MDNKAIMCLQFWPWKGKSSQLEVHGAPISKEDINQKFLRSLPSSWNQIALIMRNKPDIDEIDIDDLYNNLRVYEDELKRSSGSNSASQNLAFLSSENTGSTNEVSTASGDFGVSTAGGINQVPSTPCAHDMDGDDLEELDLRWQVAMLTVRVKKFIQRTGRNMDFKEKRPVSLDKSKIECYNCHRKGHFARECRSGRNQGRRSYGDNGRSNAPTTESSSQALVAQDGLGGYDWSNDFEVEPVNYALMAISSSSSSSSSDSEGYELALESLESRILVHEKNELAWGEKYEFQNYELKCREIKINNLNLELVKVVKERDELKLKIEKWEESSKNLDELLNSQMSARDKTSLGYGTQLNEMSNSSETDSEISLSVFDVRSSDEENTLANDSLSKVDGFHVVPPSHNRERKTNDANTKKPKSVSESVMSNPKINRDSVIIEDWNSDDEEEGYEMQTVRPETQTVKTRDDKSGQTSKKQGIGFKKVKACFVCKSTDHLIKDCNFHDKKSQEPKLKNVVNTGQREGKPVWDNTKRVNHQNFSKYPHLSKTFVPSGVLTRTGFVSTARPSISTARPSISTARPVCTARPSISTARPSISTARPSISTARPVCTARPSISTARPSISTARPVCTARPSISTARPVYASRPIYPRMDNVRPRGSCSPIKRSYYTKPAFRPKDLKQDVKTFGVKNMTTAGKRAVVNTGKGKLDTDLKKSRWVWRPKGNYLDHVSKDSGSFMLKKVEYVDPKGISKSDHAVVDSGCSSHMTGNKAYLSDYEDFNGGFVTFGSDLKEGLEKQLNHNVKIIRCDNGTEFKNYAMNEFCDKKGIKREFSVAAEWVLVTKPQNKTPYELLIGKSPSISFMRPFGCSLTILNTLDSLGKFDGKSDEDQPNVAGTGPNWMFDLDFLTNSMNYIPVSVENQVNVDAGTQDSYVAGSSGKDKGPIQEYILHKDIQDSKDVIDKEGQHQMPEDEQVLQDELEMMVTQELVAKAMDDVSRQAFKEEKRRIASQKKVAQATSTSQLSTDRPFVSTGRSNTPYLSAASTPTGANAKESSIVYLGGKIPIDASTLPNTDLPIDPNMPDLEDAFDTLLNDGIFNGAYDNDEDVGAVTDFNNMDNTIAVSPIPTLRIHKDHQNSMQEELLQFKLQEVWVLVDLIYGKKVTGTKWVFMNKRDERSIVVKNKERLVIQGFRQEEGIDYNEVFAPVARIEAIGLFLAFASYMGFIVYQMDVKSAFLYGTIKEEVYVHQPPGFVDHAHPNKVYKVIKALYGLHQAPRAWYETLSSFLMENGFRR